MIPFCGFDRCSMDANGRVKLSPKVLADFGLTGPDPVIHCLPEGALGIYPEKTFLEMRGTEEHSARMAGASFIARRTMRRFGAMSTSASISAQGRLTIPSFFREYAGLKENSDLIVVGVEIGIELWSPARWAEEQKRIHEHMIEKDRREMDADLGENGSKPIQ